MLRCSSRPIHSYRVWCSIFYSKLVNCILFKIIVQHVRFVKGRGTCSSGERNVKILIDFPKSPRFSLTLPLSQLREKSSRPVFTMCGERLRQVWLYYTVYTWLLVLSELFWPLVSGSSWPWYHLMWPQL